MMYQLDLAEHINYVVVNRAHLWLEEPFQQHAENWHARFRDSVVETTILRTIIHLLAMKIGAL